MSLFYYVLRRILEAVPLIFGLVTIVFFLSRLLPGSVTDALLSPTIPEAVRDQLQRQFGLDRPLLEQYWVWLSSVFSGDLGMSLARHAPVADIIGEVFPNTILLAGAALFLEVVLGISLAAATFFTKRKRVEMVLANALLVVYALPSFWVGIMLLVIFSYGLGLFPSSQMYSSGQAGSVPDILHHLVLPACTAAIPAAAGLARYLQSNVSAVMQQPYVLHARSMGLPQRKIFSMYVLPNAITPIVSLIGVEIGILLTGVLVTEVLFSWPGMGQLTVAAIYARDYPLILGCTLVAGVVVIAGNMLADILNAFIDPRLRIGG